MPAHPCRWPTCVAYVRRPATYCDEHADDGREARRERDRFYDRHVRDPESKRFYDSAAWQRARATKLADRPVCERCERVFAQHVHHRKPLADCTPAERVDQRLLMSVCQPCHNAIEKETAG